MRDKKMQNRITLFLGIFLSFGMVAGLVSPLLLSQQNLNPAQTRPTNTPRPTQPAPPDVSTINFDQTYLHPSGLFTAAIPTNYLLSNEFNSSSEAQVTMENSAALSVLEIRVIRPTLEASLDSPQNLGEFRQLRVIHRVIRQTIPKDLQIGFAAYYRYNHRKGRKSDPRDSDERSYSF